MPTYTGGGTDVKRPCQVVALPDSSLLLGGADRPGTVGP